MAGCSTEQLELIKATIDDAGFQDTKAVFIQTVCQNFTFTSEQAAELLALFDFSDSKLEAVDLFNASLVDPSNADPILDTFDDEDAKQAAADKLASFSATAAREIAPIRIEDDGHRSQEAMDRLLAALDDASMSSDKLDALRAEITEHPSPPFEQPQVSAILEQFSFSSDKKEVLSLLVGPGMAYPMTCEQIIAVLDGFSMSSDKIEILPCLKPFIHDAQNKLTIVASFSFSSDKAKAEEILRDVVVNFRPKTPPQAAIQEALRRVGRCPAGYDWRKVEGGWRCQAGGHYVSDARLEEAMV